MCSDLQSIMVFAPDTPWLSTLSNHIEDWDHLFFSYLFFFFFSHTFQNITRDHQIWGDEGRWATIILVSSFLNCLIWDQDVALLLVVLDLALDLCWLLAYLKITYLILNLNCYPSQNKWKKKWLNLKPFFSLQSGWWAGKAITTIYSLGYVHTE